MKTYVSEDRTTLVRIWDNRDTAGLGTLVEVARREHPDAAWEAPTRLAEERWP